MKLKYTGVQRNSNTAIARGWRRPQAWLLLRQPARYDLGRSTTGVNTKLSQVG